MALGRLEQLQNDLCRLVLEKHHQQNMAAKHISIDTWLEALGMMDYLPLFSNFAGVEDLLYVSEADIRDLGLKNAAHRAKIVSSLRLLREKYERSTLPGRKGLAQQQVQRSHSATAQLSWSPPSLVGHPDYQVVQPISPEKLQQDLIQELQGDQSDLKSKAWYHGSISRQHADKIITKNGDFLVRDCISQPGDFVLTCCWRSVPLHFVINSTVKDQGPTSLPKVTYSFETVEFGSVQDLIQYYMDECKPVTDTSGAVITTPIARRMPLSYYDSKYGALVANNAAINHYSAVQPPHVKVSPYSSPKGSPQGTPGNGSPRNSPHGTPGGSPSGSPQTLRRQHKVERSGSQPLLGVDLRAPPSVMDRADSLPVITGIYKTVTPTVPNPPVSQMPQIFHQRSGSAPLVTPDVTVTQHFDSLAPPTQLSSASSDSDLHKTPPPKPSRIPSVKYKQKPQVVVRNIALYEDDSRDYSDYGQVKEDPSWLKEKAVGKFPTANQNQANFPNSQNIYKRVGEDLYDNNFKNNTSHDVNQNIQKTNFTESQFRKISDTRFTILDGHDYSEVPQFPVDQKDVSIQMKNQQNTRRTIPEKDIPKIKIPMIKTEPSFDVHNYKSFLLPDENKLLDPPTLLTVRKLILDSCPKDIAKYLTLADLKLLKVMNEDDLGVLVTSGLELITLPQGKQMRLDVLERIYCVRAFVMVMTLTCPKVVDRAHMLSQWIQIAMEVQSMLGNLFAFDNIMAGLMSDQIQRLRDTWMILRQNHTSSAFLFDTKLKSGYKSLNDGSSSLPVQDVCIPNITPVVQLLERDNTDTNPLPWELLDLNSDFDIMLMHLDMARLITAQCGVYRVTAQALMKDLEPDGQKSELFMTEFLLRFLWGFKGAGANRTERHNKFEQLLTAYSEKMERTGDDGTAV